MARGGVYKSEVEKARNSLLAQNKHPSVDAVRIALGNTGSKTTIHRYLKELEAEDAQGVGGKFAVSDALTDLVSRLAGQLNVEADQRITEARQQFDAQLQQRTSALEQEKRERVALAEYVQRLETTFQTEQGQHAAARIAVAEATTKIGQLEERVAGLLTRLADHEAHSRSLEEKHQHAREALEHYRVAAKEQRDQELRRNEHQVQQLQVEVRQAQDAIAAKNHELLQLNRDNVRLTEQNSQADKQLHQVRTDLRRLEHELQALRPIAQEHEALQQRWAQEQLAGQSMRNDLDAANSALAREREARQGAETAAAVAAQRVQVMEDLYSRLGPASPGATEAEPAKKAKPTRGGST